MRLYHLFIYIVGFLGLIVFLAVPVSAQDKDPEVSINVSASADIISTIEMVTIQSMNLSKAKTINNSIRINPRTSVYAGKMIAIGAPKSDIRISFLEQRELTRRKGSESLLFNYEVAGNTRDDQSTAELLDKENRDFEFNEEGRFYLWIGGSVDISTAYPGNYEGEFTLEIEYI